MNPQPFHRSPPLDLDREGPWGPIVQRRPRDVSRVADTEPADRLLVWSARFAIAISTWVVMGILHHALGLGWL